MNMDLSLAVIIAAVFVVAGFVKGVIGLGLPTVAIALLGLVMPPLQAMALLVVPSLLTNLWQLAAGPRLSMLLQRLWPMLLGICAGTAGGVALDLQSEHATSFLGGVLIVYAAFGLSQLQFRFGKRTEEWVAPLAGVATGLLAVASGVLVIPAVPFLQALDLDKDELVQALGLSFTVSTLALAVALAGQGAFHVKDAGVSLAALLPALIGMGLGQWLRARIAAPVFRRCFFAGLLLLGMHMVVRSYL
ncbi:MAG TPA: sulfite exporter TauE/SafE family protein [Noviherbaspirillum sp.]